MSGNEKVIGAGQELFRQGQKGGDLYFIKSGQVELTIYDEETRAESVLAVIGEKSVLGTMSFLEGEPRSATAKAKTEVTCIIIDSKARENLLKKVPAWLQVLIKDLSGNLRRVNGDVLNLKMENEKLQKWKTVKEKQEAEAKEKEAADKAAKEPKAAEDKQKTGASDSEAKSEPTEG